jgi:hypothetical protein
VVKRICEFDTHLAVGERLLNRILVFEGDVGLFEEVPHD